MVLPQQCQHRGELFKNAKSQAPAQTAWTRKWRFSPPQHTHWVASKPQQGILVHANDWEWLPHTSASKYFGGNNFSVIPFSHIEITSCFTSKFIFSKLWRAEASVFKKCKLLRLHAFVGNSPRWVSAEGKPRRSWRHSWHWEGVTRAGSCSPPLDHHLITGQSKIRSKQGAQHSLP